MRKALLSLVAVALLAPSVVAQAQGQNTMDIYFIDTEGGQATLVVSPSEGILGAKETLLLDAGNLNPVGRDATRILAAMEDANVERIDYLVVTHYHGDHTGGNPIFGREAVIIAHKNVRERLTSPRTRGDRTAPAMASEGWPVITFDDSLFIHFNGEKIREFTDLSMAVVLASPHRDIEFYVEREGQRVGPLYVKPDYRRPERSREVRRLMERAGAEIVFREIEDLSHTYAREENDRILEWFDPKLALPRPS